MMQKKKILVVVAIALVCMTAAGIFLLSFLLTPTPERPKAIDNAASLYAEACATLSKEKNMTMQVSLTKQICVDGAVFLESSEQSILIKGLLTPQMQILLDEQITIGTYEFPLTEIFAEDTVYATVAGSHFSSQCSAEAYQQRLIPPILLDSVLYRQISGEDDGEKFTIYLSEANKPEAWLGITNVNLTEASGTVHVDHEGNLQSSTYRISYNYGGVEITQTVDAVVTVEDPQIQVPENTQAYKPITYLDGPKMLEYATGHLLQSQSISSNYTDTIYFEALGDKRTQQIRMHAADADSWSAYVATDITTTNDSRADQKTTLAKRELYINDTYTVSNNGAAYEENSSIKFDSMFDYFQNLLVSTVMLPEHVDACTYAQYDSTVRIEFTGTTAFAEHLCNNAAQILYQSPSLWDDSPVTTKELTGYLEFDPITGLPTSAGINYSGSYKREGLPYSLQYTADQSYVTPSSFATNEIRNAAG